jgi:hypothetical protein
VISADYTGFHGIEASDTEMVSVEHPAIRGLRAFAPVEGLGAVHISGNMLNGYFMQDGIILRMAL